MSINATAQGDFSRCWIARKRMLLTLAAEKLSNSEPRFWFGADLPATSKVAGIDEAPFAAILRDLPHAR